MSKSSKLAWQMLLNIFNRFIEEHCFNRAASLAYTTLLSMVPMALVSLSILSLFPIFRGVGSTLQVFLLNNFVADSAAVIAQQFQAFSQQLRVLSLATLGTLLVACLLMIYNLVSAFNAIWHVKMQRHFALSFLVYLFFIVLTPLLFGVLLVLTSYLASLPWLGSVLANPSWQKPLLGTLPYFFSFLVFTFFNWALPSCRVRLPFAVLAGWVTTLLFECAKAGFALYIRYIPTYKLVYGALATIPLFFMWMYVSWIIILFGALLCHEMSLMSRRSH